MNPLRQLEDFGQSVWLDYIRRQLLVSPEFRRMLEEDGLKGMTSNPSIFEKAIAGSADYDEQLERLARAGKSADEIYEALSLDDIRTAADALRPLWERSAGRFGYVSYEVSPELAHDTEGTLVAVRRYWSMLGRPNVMIKVPATPAGIPAIEQLTSEGTNINITLMFSLRHYDAVAAAYLRGLERRAQAGEELSNVASVASVFVSRIDTLVDRLLEEKLKAHRDEAVAALRGKAAVANAKLLYQHFKEYFFGERFRALGTKGARIQEVLWGSTSTKNHAYSDIKYVEELIGPHTVNTIPPETLDAFRDHGRPEATLEQGLEEARETVRRLKFIGIDLDEVGEQLQREGVKLFAKSFEDLHAVIRQRCEALAKPKVRRQEISAPAWKELIGKGLAQAEAGQFAARLWQRDPMLWKKAPEHQAVIRNALGWLTVPELMEERVAELNSFAESVGNDGFADVIVLGMGGSSLCPEFFARTFSPAQGFPRLHVLDTTVPAAIKSLEGSIDLARTLFVVASKSGGTIETLSHCALFFDLVSRRRGQAAGAQFIAITDAGTSLEKLAAERGFRRIFLNPADIGGRYSALSYFGLVPAALLGMDIGRLLDRARRMAQACAPAVKADENPGLSLGVTLGTLQQAGRDKVTFIVSPPISGFGLWVEQLIAESSGKESTGLVPVVDEPLGEPSVYAADRLFVYVRLTGAADPAQDRIVEALEGAGMPVVRISLDDKLDVGQEFMRWEIATAIACAVMGVNAFDQPNVQESKENTARLLGELARSGKLPRDPAAFQAGNLKLYLPTSLRQQLSADGFDDTLRRFLKLGGGGDYFAIMAYVAPSALFEKEVAAIRESVRNRLGMATTFGYGPRFLHSTGQLHKGGANNGLFIQITQDHADSIPVPGASYNFAALNEAQYLGDYQSLERHQRRVLRVHLEGEPDKAVEALRGKITEVLA